MPSRVVVSWLLVTAAVLLAPPAAATPSFRLLLVEESSARGCIDEGGLKQSVASRLGYDPFALEARATILLRLSRSAAGLVGSMEVVEADGAPRGKRELVASSASCDEMLRAMALSISIAIDPELALAAAPPANAQATPASPAAEPPPTVALVQPPPPPAVPPVVVTAPRAREPAPPSLPRSSALTASATALAAFGIAPKPAWGAELVVQRQAGRFAFGAGARVARSARAGVDGDAELRATLAAGQLEGCFRAAPLEYCGLVLLGATWARATDVDVPRTDSGLFAAAGARVGLVAALTPAISLLARGELLGVAAPIRPQVDGAAVWSAPVVAASLGLGLRLRFW